MRCRFLSQHIRALIVLDDNRHRAACRQQQRSQLAFDKARLLIRIAKMAERRTHVNRPARLALEERVIATQMFLGALAAGAELL